MKKAGIVIISFNAGNYLELTLQSILKAKTKITYAIGVIDNGSVPKEKKRCKALVKRLQNEYPDKEFRFYDVEKNLGFSGGNNVVIQEFLKDSEITHICLLNSDVIVTDDWLDILIEKDCDVTGPVTNAAGNEQTIQIDYTVQEDFRAFDKVNQFAQKRRKSYYGYMTKSDLVTFFAVVFKRTVIEQTGLLDEQFFPGSYEDDDYCMRVLKAGYQIVIARDCFIHHFGSGSFAKLKMADRQVIANKNRERFEKKWNCEWRDRTYKLLESCRQDMDFLLDKEQLDWQRRQIDASMLQIEQLMEDWGKAIRFFSAQTDHATDGERCYSMSQLLYMIWAKLKRKTGQIPHAGIQKINRIRSQHTRQKYILSEMQRIYELIASADKNGHSPVCVFAPMYNRENEKDGYVQRVKAIDTTVLSEMCRIYLYDEGVDCQQMRFDIIDELHGYIVFNSTDSQQLNLILELVKICQRTYIHSLLRFMEDRTCRELWQIFDYEQVRHVWDVHGAVVEEYALSGSETGRGLAENIERVLAEKADVIVVVTDAMGRYLRQKYPFIKAEMIIIPILNSDLLQETEPKKRLENNKEEKEHRSVVYAGGMQPWQNIHLMQQVMQMSLTRYHYKIFVPDPQQFLSMWGERPGLETIVVQSKTPEELYQEYEDCDFGFVLRDDSPVNEVACPTKIVEYLKYGIIPVFKSAKIGDFVQLGVRYLSYTELMNGICITEQTRHEMIKSNDQALNRLKQTYREGIATLKQWMENVRTAVGLVVTTFDKGGLEQVVLNLYFGYKKQGIQVYLMCQENQTGVMAQQIAEGDLFVFDHDIHKFSRFLDEKKITLLHYHYNVFGCREAKKRGVQLIYTMHNVYTWKSDSQMEQYSRLLNTMDHIVCVSNLVKNYYLARTHADAGNVQVIYNGINIEELEEAYLPDNLKRESLGLEKTDFVIAFVASFYPVKYQIGMIGVMEQLIRKYPNVRLLFVGNRENKYFQKFESEYQKSSAREQMQVVPYFEHRYMGAFLRNTADLFTLPTLQEGCSNAVLEAVCCEKPMVLTNVGNAMDVSYLKSCEIVSPAYSDIITTSNEDMIRISVCRNSANQKQLVSAFERVIDHFDTYKKAAHLTDEEKAQYASGYMVQQYLKLIRESVSAHKNKEVFRGNEYR